MNKLWCKKITFFFLRLVTQEKSGHGRWTDGSQKIYANGLETYEKMPMLNYSERKASKSDMELPLHPIRWHRSKVSIISCTGACRAVCPHCLVVGNVNWSILGDTIWWHLTNIKLHVFTPWLRHLTSRNEFNRYTSTCPERQATEICSAALLRVANNSHRRGWLNKWPCLDVMGFLEIACSTPQWLSALSA
jgi:hypothetical protein